ncbi:MAG: hypothetical protein R2795_16800 [Saprospiraceae bacterium]
MLENAAPAWLIAQSSYQSWVDASNVIAQKIPFHTMEEVTQMLDMSIHVPEDEQPISSYRRG